MNHAAVTVKVTVTVTVTLTLTLTLTPYSALDSACSSVYAHARTRTIHSHTRAHTHRHTHAHTCARACARTCRAHWQDARLFQVLVAIDMKACPMIPARLGPTPAFRAGPDRRRSCPAGTQPFTIPTELEKFVRSCRPSAPETPGTNSSPSDGAAARKAPRAHTSLPTCGSDTRGPAGTRAGSARAGPHVGLRPKFAAGRRRGGSGGD